MELLIKLGIFLLLAAIGYWRGGRNEREHLKWLAAEEQRLSGVLVFAGRYPPPSERTLDPLLVSGCVVVGSDVFRLLIASLRKIVGGNYRSYEKLMDRGRRHALVKLKADAQARGAAMVFNVRYTASGVANTRAREAPQIQVIAYGTAFVHAAGSVAQSRVAHRPSTHIHDHDGQTDLWRHPVAKWWVIGWFAGVAYCFAELFTDSVWTHAWRYVDGAPWAVYGAVAALGTAALMALARKHRLGWGESLILSMLTVPMLAAAFYFLGLRLNALTAPDTVAVRYELQADLRLLPTSPHADKPALRFTDYLDYWSAQKPGTTVEVLVVRGWLGFEQYDLNGLREGYRAYYRSK